METSALHAPKGGFLLVHLATSVILLGGLMGKFGFVRAFNELHQNQPVTVFWKVKGPDPNSWKNPFSLPFSVRLDQFEVIKHDPEYRLYAFTQPDGKGGSKIIQNPMMLKQASKQDSRSLGNDSKSYRHSPMGLIEVLGLMMLLLQKTRSYKLCWALARPIHSWAF